MKNNTFKQKANKCFAFSQNVSTLVNITHVTFSQIIKENYVKFFSCFF